MNTADSKETGISPEVMAYLLGLFVDTAGDLSRDRAAGRDALGYELSITVVANYRGRVWSEHVFRAALQAEPDHGAVALRF